VSTHICFACAQAQILGAYRAGVHRSAYTTLIFHTHKSFFENTKSRLLIIKQTDIPVGVGKAILGEKLTRLGIYTLRLGPRLGGCFAPQKSCNTTPSRSEARAFEGGTHNVQKCKNVIWRRWSRVHTVVWSIFRTPTRWCLRSGAYQPPSV